MNSCCARQVILILAFLAAIGKCLQYQNDKSSASPFSPTIATQKFMAPHFKRSGLLPPGSTLIKNRIQGGKAQDNNNRLLGRDVSAELGQKVELSNCALSSRPFMKGYGLGIVTAICCGGESCMVEFNNGSQFLLNTVVPHAYCMGGLALLVGVGAFRSLEQTLNRGLAASSSRRGCEIESHDITKDASAASLMAPVGRNQRQMQARSFPLVSGPHENSADGEELQGTKASMSCHLPWKLEVCFAILRAICDYLKITPANCNHPKISPNSPSKIRRPSTRSSENHYGLSKSPRQLQRPSTTSSSGRHSDSSEFFAQLPPLPSSPELLRCSEGHTIHRCVSPALTEETILPQGLNLTSPSAILERFAGRSIADSFRATKEALANCSEIISSHSSNESGIACLTSRVCALEKNHEGVLENQETLLLGVEGLETQLLEQKETIERLEKLIDQLLLQQSELDLKLAEKDELLSQSECDKLRLLEDIHRLTVCQSEEKEMFQSNAMNSLLENIRQLRVSLEVQRSMSSPVHKAVYIQSPSVDSAELRAFRCDHQTLDDSINFIRDPFCESGHQSQERQFCDTCMQSNNSMFSPSPSFGQVRASAYSENMDQSNISVPNLQISREIAISDPSVSVSQNFESKSMGKHSDTSIVQDLPLRSPNDSMIKADSGKDAKGQLMTFRVCGGSHFVSNGVVPIPVQRYCSLIQTVGSPVSSLSSERSLSPISSIGQRQTEVSAKPSIVTSNQRQTEHHNQQHSQNENPNRFGLLRKLPSLVVAGAAALVIAKRPAVLDVASDPMWLESVSWT